MPRVYTRKSIQERFLTKIKQGTSCWEWTGALNNNNYGVVGKSDGGWRFAHRVAYEILYGPIPKGLTIDHLCRNRKCVNPLHLEAVTSRVNTLRGIGPTARNAKKTHCPKGHKYDEKNTGRDKNGGRYCRACVRSYYHRMKKT